MFLVPLKMREQARRTLSTSVPIWYLAVYSYSVIRALDSPLPISRPRPADLRLLATSDFDHPESRMLAV